MQRIFVPSGRVRLARMEERLLPAFRQALRRVAFDVLSSNGLQRSLTASLESRGDLDPITEHWGKQVPHLTGQVETAYKAAVHQMAAAREFKPYHSTLVQLATADPLEQYLAQVKNRVVGIGDTMFRDAAQKLSEGLQVGATEPELAARVRHSLNVSVQRSDTIARTEALGALNAADTAVYRAAGTQGMKLAREWIAADDERTREAHAEADGQVVELGEPFDVDGEALDYPGDPAGSAENVINCRCTTAPVQVEGTAAEKAIEDVFPKMASPQPYEVAYKDANPGTGVSFRNNCHFCVNAMEMRARGYDVVAAQTYKSLGRYTDVISEDFVDTQKGRAPAFANIDRLKIDGYGLPGVDNMLRLEKATETWPAGARGYIAGNWTRGGGGHIFNMYKDADGKLHLIDGQNAQKNATEYLERMDHVRILRVDDKEFVPERMKQSTTHKLEAVTPANQLAQARAMRAQLSSSYKSYYLQDMDMLDKAITTLAKKVGS